MVRCHLHRSIYIKIKAIVGLSLRIQTIKIGHQHKEDQVLKRGLSVNGGQTVGEATNVNFSIKSQTVISFRDAAKETVVNSTINRNEID